MTDLTALADSLTETADAIAHGQIPFGNRCHEAVQALRAAAENKLNAGNWHRMFMESEKQRRALQAQLDKSKTNARVTCPHCYGMFNTAEYFKFERDALQARLDAAPDPRKEHSLDAFESWYNTQGPGANKWLT